MSLNFGTDNVYYVPEGESLVFFDIYDMRRLEMNLDRWGLFYNESHISFIRDSIQTASDRWENHQKKNKVGAALQAVQSFLADLPVRAFPAGRPLNMNDLLSPQVITLWVRCSDVPLESFYEEDYPMNQPASSAAIRFAPLIGAVYLAAIGDFELSIHEYADQEGFFLEIPDAQGVGIAPLDPDAILPLMKDSSARPVPVARDM